MPSPPLTPGLPPQPTHAKDDGDEQDRSADQNLSEMDELRARHLRVLRLACSGLAQNGVGGIAWPAGATVYGAARLEIAELVDVDDQEAIVDRPMAFSPGPFVEVARPDAEQLGLAVRGVAQGDGDIGFARRAIAVEIDDDVG